MINTNERMITANEKSLTFKPHSHLGITSLIIGLAFLFLAGLLCLFLVLADSHLMLKGLFGIYIFWSSAIFALSVPVMHLVGVILGMVGWFSKDTKNLFPIIGTFLNLILGILGVLINLFWVSTILALMSVSWR